MSYAGEVDDLVIGFAMSGQEYFESELILGFAGPVTYRSQDWYRETLPITTISGIMRFNTESIEAFGYSEDDFYAIVLHEIGKLNIVCDPGPRRVAYRPSIRMNSHLKMDRET